MTRKLAVKQKSEYQGHKLWHWSVELDGPDEELNKVAYVQYTLHPTFPDPVQRVTNRRSKFRLKSSGWGEFMIHVEVGYKNGKTECLEHWLELTKAEAGGPAKSAQTKGARAMGAAAGGATAAAEGERRHRMFVSNGIADLPFARALQEALMHYGVEVLMADETGDLPPEVKLRALLDKADSACFILSDRPNNWIMREFLAARERGLRVGLLMLTGKKFEVPEEMGTFEGFRITVKHVPLSEKDEELKRSAHSAAKRLASSLGLHT